MEQNANESITCKFGGTSLADSKQIERVVGILNQDADRRFIVVSAPGKRTPSDKKITDLLYLCHQTAKEGLDVESVFSVIRQRYESIAAELNVDGVTGWLDTVEAEIKRGAGKDWAASRGEYLHARILANALDATFIDTAECVRFDSEGRLNPVSYDLILERVSNTGRYVFPGFYGTDARGQIRTFSRGGSDVTGAIVARAVRSRVYENWTDVDGLLMADPRIVDSPLPIREVTYSELRELAYMGASVLHDEAIFPVSEAQIPINIRNTNAPEQPGTWIAPTRENSELPIVGIAGRSHFSTIYVEKALMNQEKGFGRRLLEILENHHISYEHAPSSIDSMSVILSNEELGEREAMVRADIARVLQPDRVEVLPGLALIATVGQGMSHRVGVAKCLFSALSDSSVNVRMINQGASEINIIVGVADSDYEKAIRAIYSAFVV